MRGRMRGKHAAEFTPGEPALRRFDRYRSDGALTAVNGGTAPDPDLRASVGTGADASPLRFRLSPVLAVVVTTLVVLLALLGLWRTLAGSNTGDGIDPADSVHPRAEATREAEGLDDPDLLAGGVRPQSAGDVGKVVGYGLSEDAADAAATMVVHVVGAVSHPGIVELPVGSRIIDAIEGAGGAGDGADLSSLNLAAFLTDGAQVHVPVEGEGTSASGSGPETASSGVGGGADASRSTGIAACVDLNSASEAELQELDGVGPKLAARIAQWRATAGPVSSADDLLAVPGIGQILVSRIAASSCQ